MRRFVFSVLSLIMLGGLVACSGGSSLDNSGEPVFLTVEIKEHNPDVNVCATSEDLTVARMIITSKSKDPQGNLTSNQDVNLRDWDITPVRVEFSSKPVHQQLWRITGSIPLNTSRKRP